jgi:hypothetical protein
MSGIRTLEDLRIRCVIERVSHCWRYPTSISEDGLPRVAIPPGVFGDKWITTTARKAGWLLAGKSLKKGLRVYQNDLCDRRDCCNPEHTKASSQAVMATTWVSRGHFAKLTSVRNNSVQAATHEQLAEVMRLVAEKLNDREIAVLVGLHPQTVGKIRHGRHLHQRPLHSSSVFEMAEAA